jgi:hypothetical protein
VVSEWKVTRRRPVILGIDPGTTVGIAYYVKGKFSSRNMMWEDAVPWVKGIILGQPIGEKLDIFTERFIIGANTGKKSQQTKALEIIGAIRYEAASHSHVNFELQNTSEAKRLSTDDKLRGIDWYKPGPRHCNDAARHVLFGMLRRYPEELELVMSGGTKLENTPI